MLRENLFKAYQDVSNAAIVCVARLCLYLVHYRIIVLLQCSAVHIVPAACAALTMPVLFDKMKLPPMHERN